MTDMICFIHPNTAPLHNRSAHSLGTTCIPPPDAQSTAYFKLMDRAVHCISFYFLLFQLLHKGANHCL